MNVRSKYSKKLYEWEKQKNYHQKYFMSCRTKQNCINTIHDKNITFNQFQDTSILGWIINDRLLKSV